MLVELDDKFYDVDLTEYFTFTEQEKDRITEVVLSFFNEYVSSSPRAMNTTKRAFLIKKEEAVMNEEYEVADILSRSLVKLREITFSE